MDMKIRIAPENTLKGIVENRRAEVKMENAGLTERITQESQQMLMNVYNVAHSHRMSLPGPRFISGEGKAPQNLTFISGKHIDIQV